MRRALFFAVAAALAACGGDGEKSAPVDTPFLPGEEVNGPRVAWDYSSQTQLADMGGYPRLERLGDNELIAVFETYTGNIVMRRSRDNGATWNSPQTLFSQFTQEGETFGSTTVNMANPEIIRLTNGDLVVGCNYRPQYDEITPFAIAVRRSTDGGATWLPAEVLYRAGPRFRDGCWEPSFLQLPDGELQVYFANESPYRNSDEQEISVITSPDNGTTWDEARTVSFRAGRRDGMPVAAIVGGQIVVSIEDNRVGQFKPYTVRTSLADNWREPVPADSPMREYALAETIPEGVYMGAPYIVAMPTGETLISYQTNRLRDSNWELSTMEVAIGDAGARNFGNRTRPFDVPLTREAKWNSLAVWGVDTVAAFASSNARSQNIAPWLIRGYIQREPQLQGRQITDLPLFVGAKGTTRVRAGVGSQEGNLYVECVADDESSVISDSPGGGDGVYLYFYDGKKAVRIWCGRNGRTAVCSLNGGGWRSVEANGVTCAAAERAGGYGLLATIPREGVGIAQDAELRFALALSARQTATSGYLEMSPNAREDQPNSWIKTKGE